MKRVMYFLVAMALSVSAYANDINVRTSVQNMKNSADGTAVFATAGTDNATSDSLSIRGSKEVTFVYNTTSSGAVDLDLYASFSADGTNDVGSTKIADIVATGYGVANVSTVYALPYIHLVVDGQGANDASTETTIKAGQR